MIQGEVLHYRILEQIGEGGMGIVLKALDTKLDRLVAIKAIHERLFSDSRAKARLRREALAAASIDHPFICKVYELIQHEGQTLVVMEYVKGESLHAAMKRGPLPIADALRYMAEIAEALGEIHRQRMVHRDVKPSNIMITHQRHAKLMDFGIARSTDPPDQDGATLLTADGGLVGTPRYMAPEQVAGDPADARSDVFSLGVVMFVSLSGEHPFDGDSNNEYLSNLLTRPAKQLRAVSPETPEELNQIVGKCLSRDPAQRFETADRLAEALIGASSNLSAHRTSDGEPFGKRLIFAFSLALLAMLLLAWSIWGPDSQPKPPQRFVASESVLVTWPSEETGGQISPDGQWVSFLSDRGGKRYGLWLAPLAGGEPRPVAGEHDPAVITHVWSPDSRRIALIASVGETRLLKIVPAFGGPPDLVYPLKEWEFLDPRLVSWTGRSIYLQMNQRLWRFQPESLALHTVNSLELNFVDVRDDEKKILYTPPGDDQRIWMANIDGTDSVRITAEGVAESNGLWIDHQRYLFQSSRTGQMDVWESNAFADNPLPQRIASSNLQIGDVSKDGRTVLLTRVFENADLWCINRQTGTRRQLTAQSASDFWGTLSADGTVFAFQRSKPTQGASNRLFDAQLHAAAASACGFRDERMVVGSGFGPLLSPDGQWLAYIKPLPGTARLELWLHHLSDQRERRVCEDLSLRWFRPFPFERLPASAAWATSGSKLYFVAQTREGASEIRALEADSEAPADLIARLGSGEKAFDLKVVDSGHKLYTVVRSRQSGWRVDLRDLTNGGEKTIYRDEDADEIYLPGPPLKDGRLVVLRGFVSRRHFEEQRVEALALFPSGQTRSLGTIQRAAGGGGAVLDGRTETLFLTAVEGLAHNIYSFTLSRGTFRKLTVNEFEGRTFCCLTFSPDGHLMYAQQERNKEVVVLRLADVAD